MSDESNSKESTIKRCPHDKENRYVVISQALLKDEEISFKAKGFLCYLLSFPDDWKINPRYIAKKFGINKCQVYSIINELIEVGYCKRDLIKGDDGRIISWEYEISETKRYKNPSIIQNEPLPKKPEVETPNVEKADITKYCPIISNEETKDICPDSNESRSSPIGSELATLLFESIKKTKPDIKAPNFKGWALELDRMIRIDKRDLERIKAVILWLPCSDFWKKVVLSAEKFRKQFDRLELEMENGREDTWIKENRTLVQKLKEENPNALKHIILRKDSVVNKENSKDLSLKINPKQFFDLFVHITGRKYNG